MIENEIEKYGRPMYMWEKPDRIEFDFNKIRRECKCLDAAAALCMLNNNLHVALVQDELIIYGGDGRAARNWREYNRIVKTLKELETDQTLCVQSGKPVYIAQTYEHAPRVVIVNSNLVPAWATQEHFEELDRKGLMMYGQMTAGSWIYIGTQGILQGTYETLAAVARKYFNNSLKGKLVLTAGMGAMGGAQPLATTLNDAVILDVEVRRERISRKVEQGYCDVMTNDLDEALKWVLEAKEKGEALSVGLVGNAAEVYPTLVDRNIIPDVLTDQTPAHNLLSYVPIGDLKELDELRVKDPDEYKKKALESIKKHVEAMLKMQTRGSIVFDYGNNLRAQAELAGVEIRKPDGTFAYPGFVVEYIRPMFCGGRGPFRWVALSGDINDIQVLDDLILDTFPEDKVLKNWINKAKKKVPVEGLPSRICWLGYGARAKFGIAINTLVGSGELRGSIVIGRDHLDCGSVASPNRETEGMKDGSDAVADWPVLNFALNTMAGASWVSFHHGGGVGIGYSLHAGMVIVADGTNERKKRIQRVLTVDPGIGIARHVDAGYPEAKRTSEEKGVKIPK